MAVEGGKLAPDAEQDLALQGVGPAHPAAEGIHRPEHRFQQLAVVRQARAVAGEIHQGQLEQFRSGTAEELPGQRFHQVQVAVLQQSRGATEHAPVGQVETQVQGGGVELFGGGQVVPAATGVPDILPEVLPGPQARVFVARGGR